MEAGNPNRDTNSIREWVLSVLRCAEANINRGIIPRTIQSSTVSTAQMAIPPIETHSIQAEHHFVSTVTVHADLMLLYKGFLILLKFIILIQKNPF